MSESAQRAARMPSSRLHCTPSAVSCLTSVPVRTPSDSSIWKTLALPPLKTISLWGKDATRVPLLTYAPFDAYLATSPPSPGTRELEETFHASVPFHAGAPASFATKPGLG